MDIMSPYHSAMSTMMSLCMYSTILQIASNEPTNTSQIFGPCGAKCPLFLRHEAPIGASNVPSGPHTFIGIFDGPTSPFAEI